MAGRLNHRLSTATYHRYPQHGPSTMHKIVRTCTPPRPHDLPSACFCELPQHCTQPHTHSPPLPLHSTPPAPRPPPSRPAAAARTRQCAASRASPAAAAPRCPPAARGGARRRIRDQGRSDTHVPATPADLRWGHTQRLEMYRDRELTLCCVVPITFSWARADLTVYAVLTHHHHPTTTAPLAGAAALTCKDGLGAFRVRHGWRT